MLKSPSFLKRLLWVSAIATGVGACDLMAAEASAPSQVLKYTSENGQVTQALLFQLGRDTAGVVAHEHLIFVDTSASQVGSHRVHALAVVESMLKTLPESDLVRLYAVDVRAESLMNASASPKSDSVRSALSAIKSRIPLGATNLTSLFKVADESLTDGRTISVTYIGDGMSTSGILDSEVVSAAVSRCRSHKCPIHSYGVGPVINLQLLGILAHQTGGYVDFDNQQDTGKNFSDVRAIGVERGEKLALAVQRPVVFPLTAEVSGKQLPLLPLRPDRETVQLIQGELAIDAKAFFTTENSPESIEFRLSTHPNVARSSFIGAIIQQSEKDQGLSNSLAGSPLMQLFEDRFIDSVGAALRTAEQQFGLGHHEQASRIAHNVIDVDPTNPQANSLATASERLRVRQVSRITEAEEMELEEHAKPELNQSLTREQEQAVRVKTEKLQNQVNNAIKESRIGDPDNAIANLKRIDNSVRAAIDIAPEDRIQLQKRLEVEINQLRNSADKKAQERVQLAEQLAQLESQKLLTQEEELNEKKLDGLIERVRGLMLEGKAGNDEAYQEAQNVADVANNIRPGSRTATAARFNAEAAHQLVRAYRLRHLRADNFLETLYQVELAHIPFPGEPPIRFPPAEVWRSLTARRQKYKSVDLKNDNPNEKEIQRQLTEPSSAAFLNNPLKDAIETLKITHGIEIQFDKKALDEEGLNPEQEVSLSIENVTLRTVLRLLLEPIGLTYVIEDEVMKITTIAGAEKKLKMRVYPVLDLITPILGGGGGGGIGGGGIGGGGGGGGLGGGIGGGGGGGGLGGGAFSIPPEPVDDDKAVAKPKNDRNIDNSTIRNLKKK